MSPVLSPRRRPPNDEPVQPVDETPQDAQQPAPVTWSRGSDLATKAVSFAFVAAILAGPAAAAWVVLQPTPEPVAQSVGDGVDWSAGEAAGERGADLVTRWLHASRDDDQGLSQIAPATGATLDMPRTGLDTRNSTVAQLDPLQDGLWSVIVAIDVSEPADESADESADEEATGEEATHRWVRRYYQVPVIVTPGAGDRYAVAAQALPAAVGAPEPAQVPESRYVESIPATGAAGTSVEGFLAAYLVGDGELERYVSPGSVVTAIDPPAYTSVRVRDLMGTTSAPDMPSDGDETRVQASVELVRADGEKTTSQYQLALRARAGRWEVAGLDQAGQINPADQAANEGEN